MLRLCDVLQAHTAPIRCITFTHSDKWLLSTDDSGLVRLWTPRLELAQVRDQHTGAADLSPILLARRTVSRRAKESLSSGARQHANKGHSCAYMCAGRRRSGNPAGPLCKAQPSDFWGCSLPGPCCQPQSPNCHSGYQGGQPPTVCADRDAVPLQDIRAHNDSVRQVSLSRNDMKFVTASDDSTLKVPSPHARLALILGCALESPLLTSGLTRVMPTRYRPSGRRVSVRTRLKDILKGDCAAVF